MYLQVLVLIIRNRIFYGKPLLPYVQYQWALFMSLLSIHFVLPCSGMIMHFLYLLGWPFHLIMLLLCLIRCTFYLIVPSQCCSLYSHYLVSCSFYLVMRSLFCYTLFSSCALLYTFSIQCFYVIALPNSQFVILVNKVSVSWNNQQLQKAVFRDIFQACFHTHVKTSTRNNLWFFLFL